MTDIEKLNKLTAYMDLLEKRHVILNDPKGEGTDKLCDDLTQILVTLPIILNQLSEESKKNYRFLELPEYTSNLAFDTMRYMANLVSFVDVMKPLAAKYNPTEEDKKKFLDFIGYEGGD